MTVAVQANAFIKGAVARAMTGLARDLADLAQLEAVHGRNPVIAALKRATAFGRFRATDVISILDSRKGLPRPARPGDALVVDLPTVATRPLSDYAIGGQS